MGDLNDDFYDEILVMGLTMGGNNPSYLSILEYSKTNKVVFSSFNINLGDYRFPGVRILEYDSNSSNGKEIFAGTKIWKNPYDNTPNVAEELDDVSEFMMLPLSIVGSKSVYTGDVNGDKKDELIFMGGIYGFAVVKYNPSTGQSEKVFENTSINNYSIACPANVDNDSVVLRYKNQKETLFTNPIIISVMACPPYHSNTDQSDNSGSTFGKSTGQTIDESTSHGISSGFSFGYEHDFPFGNKLEWKTTVTNSFDWTSSKSQTVSKSVSYSSGPDEDKVVFSTIPYDVYYYTIISAPDPDDIGNTMTIDIPREIQIISTARNFYNANNGDNPDVDASIFSHTIGDVSSYLTASDKNRILNEDPNNCLYSDLVSVGIGSGQVTVGIDKSNSIGDGSSNNIDVTVEIEISSGGLKTGTSSGYNHGYEYSITNTNDTFYEGSVGNIAASKYNPGLLYQFGLFTYQRSLGGKSFTVLNYWVE